MAIIYTFFIQNALETNKTLVLPRYSFLPKIFNHSSTSPAESFLSSVEEVELVSASRNILTKSSEAATRARLILAALCTSWSEETTTQFFAEPPNASNRLWMAESAVPPRRTK